VSGLPSQSNLTMIEIAASSSHVLERAQACSNLSMLPSCCQIICAHSLTHTRPQLCDVTLLYAQERLVPCDECPVLCHTHCLSPPLRAVPEGDWRCHECRIRRSAAKALERGSSSGGGGARRAGRPVTPRRSKDGSSGAQVSTALAAQPLLLEFACRYCSCICLSLTRLRTCHWQCY
jgi:PHD-finger